MRRYKIVTVVKMIVKTKTALLILLQAIVTLVLASASIICACVMTGISLHATLLDSSSATAKDNTSYCHNHNVNVRDFCICIYSSIVNITNKTVVYNTMMIVLKFKVTLNKLEGTHRVRTYAVLLLTLTLTLTFDLSTQNHTTCRISQGHSLYQGLTLWVYSFLSYAADISVNLTQTVTTLTLTFDLSNSTQNHTTFNA